ncbi:SNF2 family DNA-dependent ATPase [Roridomyces roridus]|uniref:SNF2 family DNA-dependent ATPase n=1 Tax=Roridomyces roridus TaxID=1738132 RepID=A0AAD7BA82_9AGAR|nr:SNF2 family DNA-dependent ATPase [Roridomyces roridus]
MATTMAHDDDSMQAQHTPPLATGIPIPNSPARRGRHKHPHIIPESVYVGRRQRHRHPVRVPDAVSNVVFERPCEHGPVFPRARSEEQSDWDARYKRLERLLEKSEMYSSILAEQMEAGKVVRVAEAVKRAKKEKEERERPRKRRRRSTKAVVVEDSAEEEGDADATVEESAFTQPPLVTGARLKDYQLEGLQWMVSLYDQGLSGILADEMGLGKTLQTIAFTAYLRQQNFARPIMIVCPLSVLHNWADEYQKFAPGMPVLVYHGTPAERAAMRKTSLTMPATWGIPAPGPNAKGKGKGKGRASASASASRGRAPAKNDGNARGKAAARGRGRGRGSARNAARGRGGARGRGRGGAQAGTKRTRGAAAEYESDEDDNDDEQEEEHDADSDDEEQEEEEAAAEPVYGAVPEDKRTPQQKARDAEHDRHFRKWPIVLTTYELVMKDRPVLSGVPWGYIVVDEGHRLKNMNCALMRELRRYQSAGRMVLTGTPLHNNLAELWALLNFVLPDVFDDVDAFQEWFSLPKLSTLLPSARMGELVATLHRVLKPFLLRRMKVDVLGTILPPKKSYVLYAKLSAAQREAYEAILGGDVRGWVARSAAATATAAATGGQSGFASPAKPSTPAPSEESLVLPALAAEASASSSKVEEDVEEETPRRTMRMRSDKGKGRALEEDTEEAERVRAAEAFARRGAAKHVNNMKLQNTVMQLRKVCSHPFLFARGDDEMWAARANVTPELLAAREAELVGASGKMMLLDRLLGELFRRGHKVLLFSQFTTMLDIIEDWAVDMKGWRICRIDGSTPPLERRDQMNLFQSAGDHPDAPRLFLLSTRSGGLGVNLTAADTVIFYDQDWNPQMDAQAQDRAHRIGQTRPVLIFRLISAHTIEEKIMQRATEKRKLEALVIAKGKFKMPTANDSVVVPNRRETMAQMAADLLRLEGEQTTRDSEAVLSDADLEALLDRSPEVFVDRGTGWQSTSAEGRGAAFVVFEPPVDAGVGGEALAGIMGENLESVEGI